MCILNCDLVKNAEANDGADRCVCKANNIWNGSHCLPVCQLISFTNGSNSSNPLECPCTLNFSWVSGMCQRNCSIPKAGVEVFQVRYCYCLPGYVWFYSGTDCSTTCEGVNGVDNSSISTQYGQTTCKCKANFTWNGARCIPNCSAFPHTYGEAVL
jgi:hypothetical protein